MRDIKIVYSSGHDDLDNEALRAVSVNHTSPNRTPGIVIGVKTYMEISIPVIFRLP